MAVDQGTSGLLGPGELVTLAIEAVPGWGHISLAAMLLPTNDGIIALQKMRVPVSHHASTALAYGYDAGSEPDDEMCVSIPGPPGICGGEGVSMPNDKDEGYVHIHHGIQDVGELAPEKYDWRNPIAVVNIKRLH